MPNLEVRIISKDGWRWQLHDSASAELWLGPRLLGTLPGTFLIDMLSGELSRLALMAHFKERLEMREAERNHVEESPPRRERERLRARRKKRRLT